MHYSHMITEWLKIHNGVFLFQVYTLKDLLSLQFDFHPLKQFCSLGTGVEGNASKRMNPIFWYRTVHYPKSSFIISLKLRRQGTSCLWFSLRAMYILEINGENVCRCAHMHVHMHVVVLQFALYWSSEAQTSWESTRLQQRKYHWSSVPL